MPRAYRSPHREQQREATRRRILDVAGESFRRFGYASTTIAAVARDANVADETIYAVFGSKPELLRQVAHHETLHGAPAIVTDEWLDKIRATPDQRQRWALMRSATAEVLERALPINTVIVKAADVDPEIGRLWNELEMRRRREIEALVTLLEEAGPLRRGHRESVDIVWAMSRSVGLYEALRLGCGWSAKRAAAAVSDAIERAILA